MLYSSKNGCLFYYDSILFRWQIADPTLLFLLGLESVTSYDKSISDSIVISKYIYRAVYDTLEPLEYMQEAYDDIYSFLSKIGSVEDHEQYLKLNCYGLKLLLNSLTGISSDRTVPFIFKYSKNSSLVDPTSEVNSYSTLSYYDIQAQRIYDVFEDIGYDTSLDTVSSSGSLLPEYYIDRNKEGSIIKETLDYLSVTDITLRNSIINSILSYNSNVTTVHYKKLNNSEIYRLLDYKAMYAYSLGVLFGCRCLGYDDSAIWRIDPQYWYDDTYINLVRTAWFVFRFHWTYSIEDVSSSDSSSSYYNKYQSIQDNKIWNFTNTTDLIDAPLVQDETSCYCLYLGNSSGSSTNIKNKSDQIFYSFSTVPSEAHTLPGSYLRKYITLTGGHILWRWFSIDDKVSNGTVNDPMKGVVSSRDLTMNRYIGNDLITIYRAYKYIVDDVKYYLAPKYTPSGSTVERYKKYYVYTGDLGWVDYIEDSLLDTQHDPRHNYLEIIPNTPTGIIHYAFPIVTTSDNPGIVSYYKYYVTDHYDESLPLAERDSDSDILYGVYNKWVKSESVVPTNFDYILSKRLFNSMFTEIEASSSDDYSNKSFFNLSNTISLMTRKDSESGIYYIWDCDNIANNDKSVFYYGYSESVSVPLILYNATDTTKSKPNEEIFRYISSIQKYWSETYFYTIDHVEPGEVGNQLNRTWRTLTELVSVSLINLYSITSNTVTLYKGETRLVSSSQVYNLYSEKASSSSADNLTEYVYEDTFSLLCEGSLGTYNFMPIYNYTSSTATSLYDNGITTHLCKFILEDGDGNSLLDSEGNPAVWFDTEYNLYWNGLYNLNRWQSTKPNKNNKSMYNASTRLVAPVFDDEDGNTVSIDGADFITYAEFYSNTAYGIIRDTLQVFNPDISDDIVDCYVDTKLSEDSSDYIYCIPSLATMNTWVSRSGITALGYTFVNGSIPLYNGDTEITVVVDDDPVD